MKKGFTLIELLAVIVILAIISAIAIPIVIKVIDNTRISSLKVSMSNIEKAVELYINRNPMQENKVITCNDGVCKDELNNKLELSGLIPDSGSINITPSGTITYNKLILDGYLCDKYNNEFVCNKSSKNIEETKEDSIIIKNTNDSLSNYKVYGESVKNTELNQIENVGYKTKNLINWDYLLSNKAISKVENGYYAEIYGTNVYGIVEQLKQFLKPNVTYTLSRVYTGELNASNGMIGIRFKDGTAITIVRPGKGFVSGTFSLTQEQIDGITSMVLYFYKNGSTISNLQLEEGGTATEYEPYGKYKIPIKVIGKNLFNEELLLENNNIIKTSNGYKVQSYPVDFNKDNTLIQKLKMDLKPEITYTISRKVSGNNHDSTGSIVIKDSDGENITYIRYGDGTYSSNFSLINEKNKEINLIYIYGSSKADIYFEYIQIEEGLEATDYEPYKEIITNIYLDEPLRKVGNYVDYIDYKNQKEVRNVGVISLSSEDNFELIDNYFVLNLESYPTNDKEISISNYLEYGSNFWFDGNKLKLKIEGITTEEELKTWLSNKSVEIYYPLSKSVVSDIELPEINLNKNYSNIMIESNIKPSNMLIEYN